MSNENFLEKLATQISQSASVKNVYGEPVQAGDKTIIPVAQIAYGLGGGYGHGTKKKLHSKPGEQPKTEAEPAGEGAGGGGGMFARPKGVYEITPTCTRFIPADTTRQILTGLAIGFLLRGLIYKRKKNKVT